MRCPDCNKFTGLEMREPEVTQDPEIDADGHVTAEVRIVRECSDCGTELKEASLSLEGDVEAELVKEHSGEGHELSVEQEDVEATERNTPAKKPRYSKAFFGAEMTVAVICSCKDDEPVAKVHMSDEVQASAMDEMV